MLNLIEPFIKKMTKEDVIKFAKNNNLSVTEHEVDFVYSFIKNNYQSVLSNPDTLNLSLYKKEFSNDNYLFIENLIGKYKRMIK